MVGLPFNRLLAIIPTTRERQRFVTPRTLNFSELYGNQSRITYLDEVGFHTHNAGYRPTKHHHFCDTCQKTRKCVLCEGKPKVRKLCENCDIAETIRRLHNVTVNSERPDIGDVPSQYRPKDRSGELGQRDDQLGFEWTRVCAWCQQQLWKQHPTDVIQCSCGWTWR
jgi:hypothetical protein